MLRAFGSVMIVPLTLALCLGGATAFADDSGSAPVGRDTSSGFVFARGAGPKSPARPHKNSPSSSDGQRRHSPQRSASREKAILDLLVADRSEKRSLTKYHGQPGRSREKVILDTDMVEGFDDGVAMILLANAPGIDLVGVTTVSGNSWAASGTAYALRQLEIEGKTDIPVAMGCEAPLRPGRQAGIGVERTLHGMGRDDWTGAFGLPKPESWRAEYAGRYGSAPTMTPDTRHAVSFLIDAVRASPGEIVIAAIGPCTNLAMAVRAAPDIIPLIKRVVYMGGALHRQGNVTPAAEFNWWFDPEAAKIALRTPFREQIIVGLDVCERVPFRKEQHDRLLRTLGRSGQAQLLQSSYAGRLFADNPHAVHRVWDVIVSALLIDPSVVTKEITAFVDVNDQYGLSYGQSLAYPEQGPEGSRRARIVLEADQGKLWNMINDARYWKSAQ